MSAATPPSVIRPMVPGWFGKLPGLGDFAYRRLDEAFRVEWDEWLQTGLGEMRSAHADWMSAYLEGPLWLFLLGRDVLGPQEWLGTLMPSVDSVGRYFPLTLACERADEFALRSIGPWAVRATSVALAGLEQDLDAESFESSLQHAFDDLTDEIEQAAQDQPILQWPDKGHSLWLTNPPGCEARYRLQCAGLPRGRQFLKLFGVTAAPESSQEGAV